MQGLERAGYDQVLCLGDTVGYGAFPNECCDLIRGLDPIIVRGNHDEAAVVEGAEEWFTPAASACILWTREQLTPENRDFLAALEPFARVDGAQLCHGSLFDPGFYTTTSGEAALSFHTMEHCLCFFGHTHYAEWFVEQPGQGLPVQVSATSGGVLHQEQAKRYLVNPGGVGQPRDGNSQTSYALWDTEAATIEIVRATYNVSVAQAKMREARLPYSMSERLMLGI
jgi:diadenosine tetraphosphatase ApaH/serine/threonine PP2A family protein phosphatase